MKAPTSYDPPSARWSPARTALAALSAVLMAGCAVGPDYKRPEVAVPPAFKESPGWKVAAPADGASRGPWWEGFGDPVLSGLESQLDASNLTVAQALANYEQARQIARADHAKARS